MSETSRRMNGSGSGVRRIGCPPVTAGQPDPSSTHAPRSRQGATHDQRPRPLLLQLRPYRDHGPRAAYVLDGEVEVAGDRFEPGRMPGFRAGDRLALRAGRRGARLLLLGGAAMDGPRYLFWNFVSSPRERIEQATADWQAGRFGEVAGDEKEFIPLPERQVVRAGSRPSEPGRASEGSPTSWPMVAPRVWRDRTKPQADEEVKTDRGAA